MQAGQLGVKLYYTMITIDGGGEGHNSFGIWTGVETNKGGGMKSMIRCQACGRRRKASHEKWAGTGNAVTPQCVRYKKVKKAA